MWLEIGAAAPGDQRLKQRLRHLVEHLSQAPEQALPQVFGRWSDVKAAYRFFRQ